MKTLEAKLETLIPSHWQEGIELTAFELTREPEGGWSVNTPFNIGRGLDRSEAISRLRSRWEIFKANYDSNARVSDLEDISCGDETVCNLEVNCTAFADVRINS